MAIISLMLHIKTIIEIDPHEMFAIKTTNRQFTWSYYLEMYQVKIYLSLILPNHVLYTGQKSGE